MSNDIVGTAPHPLLLTGTDGVGGTAAPPSLAAVAVQARNTITGAASAPSLDIVAITGDVVEVELRAPAPMLTAVGISPPIVTLAIVAPRPLRSISAYTGSVGTFAGESPAPTLVLTGYPAYVMSAVLTAPSPQLSAQLTAAITAAFRTWVLNTRKGALSEYGPEFAFNSYATFNGQVLAAGASGVVVLGAQALDNAAAITARVRTGKESFGSSVLKRVPRIYTSGSYPGDMLFRTITTESGERTYSLPMNGVTGLQQRRVPVGKGPKSRFWQYEIENVAGADFSTNDIQVYPVALRRRVQ